MLAAIGEEWFDTRGGECADGGECVAFGARFVGDTKCLGLGAGTGLLAALNGFGPTTAGLAAITGGGDFERTGLTPGGRILRGAGEGFGNVLEFVVPLALGGVLSINDFRLSFTLTVIRYSSSSLDSLNLASISQTMGLMVSTA